MLCCFILKPMNSLNIHYRALALLLLGLSFLSSGCRTSYTVIVQDHDTLTQLAPFIYILSGNYNGNTTVAQFKKAGNLGIGTFQGLDGEAILLDGLLYQAQGDGSVKLADDNQLMPFGVCTLFDKDLSIEMRHIASYEQFSQALTPHFEDPKLFYAIKAPGLFKTITVRSCDQQQTPYRPLAEVTQSQHEYTYTNCRGTLVGFWTPAFVPGNIGVPGFHLHFISDDRTQGGHVLDFQADLLTLMLDRTPRINIDFSAPVDMPLLERDIENQMHSSERKRVTPPPQP